MENLRWSSNINHSHKKTANLLKKQYAFKEETFQKHSSVAVLIGLEGIPNLFLKLPFAINKLKLCSDLVGHYQYM